MRQPKRLMARYTWRTLFVLLASAAPARIAHAQPTHTRPTPVDRDQHVVFEDDLLDADLTTPFGDPVFSRHIRASRVLLIRPRTSFVPELCKSVEHI